MPALSALMYSVFKGHNDYVRQTLSLPFIYLDNSHVTESCNQHYYLIPEHFHSPKEIHTHLQSLLTFLSPSPGNHWSTFSVYELAYSGHLI